jgi:two-component system, NarL family, sensor kinase
VKAAREHRPTPPAQATELAELRARLSESDETLRAIRSGEVDAVVVEGKRGPKVFTLKGAEHAYRHLIESMNEGALTLTPDKMILYANQCFAKMVKCPLEQVVGSSFRRFLCAEDLAVLRPLVRRAGKAGRKIQVALIAGDGSQTPAQISIRALARNSLNQATVGMVVTDLTEVRRAEGLLRALTRRVVQVQEAERGRVAFELHDNITQLLCAVIFRSQALANTLPARGGKSRKEAVKICDMLAKTADEVERISHDLGPSLLDHLGLASVLRDARIEFADRTGLSVKLTCMQLTTRLPADAELALYRILQEALRNVEKHSQARHVTVRLSQQDAFVQLVIRDDGTGFAPDRDPAKRKGKGGLGLLSMSERATYVGGTLTIKSVLHAGTEIDVRIPMA